MESSPREYYVTNGPAELYVREIGRGQPILVLHGGPDFDHEYLLPEMDQLSRTFRLVYYDQRGRGRSTLSDPPSSVSLESELDDLDSVRTAIGAETVVVLGHSWGGLLAMEYAIRHSDRVSHLILLSTAPASYTSAREVMRAIAALRAPSELERLAELRGRSEFQSGDLDADTEYHRIHFRPALRSPRDLTLLLPRLRRACTSDGVVAARAIEDSLYAETWDRPDYDLHPRLRRLAIPTLVVHGDSDFIPLEIARDIASVIPTADLTVLEDCGHFGYLERPDQFAEAVRSFLARTAPTTGDRLPSDRPSFRTGSA